MANSVSHVPRLKDQQTATDNLQISIDDIFNCMRRWEIKINSD